MDPFNVFSLSSGWTVPFKYRKFFPENDQPEKANP
jgi:hypothetical protein